MYIGYSLHFIVIHKGIDQQSNKELHVFVDCYLDLNYKNTTVGSAVGNIYINPVNVLSCYRLLHYQH